MIAIIGAGLVGAVASFILAAILRSGADADARVESALATEALRQAAESEQVQELRRSRQAWQSVATEAARHNAALVALLTPEQLAEYRAVHGGMACTDGQERVA